MAIPWTNFFSSPTKIEIDNLHLALGTFPIIMIRYVKTKRMDI